MNNLFQFETPQKTCSVGQIKIGGQPGTNPTVLIGSMFHKGDALINSRKSASFDKNKARECLQKLSDISQKTSIPAIIDIVGNSADEFQAYLDFLAQETTIPLCIDAWKPEVRIETARVVAQMGLLDRIIYNSLNPWNPTLQKEVEEISAIGVRHVIVGIFDETDKFASGRIKSLSVLLPLIEKGGFSSILIDTTVMNVAAMAFSLQAGYEIKKRTGLPVGCAPSNGTYTWTKIREMGSRQTFAGADATAHGIAALLWNDFLFYGPMSGTERVFAAAAVADSIKALYSLSAAGTICASQSHPLRHLFPDFMKQLEPDQK